jgi:hypothetical protein
MTGPLEPPGFAPTNSPLVFETAEFSRFEGGLLSRHTVIIDMLGLARQIGAVPRPGGLAERVGLWGQHLAALVARAGSKTRPPRRRSDRLGQGDKVEHHEKGGARDSRQ